ncbi:MAG TPA: efflux RND transporter periplasmic adaptor subunit, partial [Coleofasciculaceae cyanobacterium]
LSLLGACSHKPPGIGVKLSSVQTATIEESSEFVAHLQSRCSVTLQPLIEGRVAKIFVKLGDQIVAGTAIIQLNSAKQKVQPQYLRISSPCAGTVGEILVNEGEYVNTSTKLATIVQNQPLEVNISVPVALASKVRLGMPVELMDREHSAGTSQVFFISPKVNQTSQTVLVKSLFDNSKGKLRTGQSVRAKLLWGKRTGILIPTTAVSREKGQAIVYVTQQGESQLVARRKPVKLGNIQGNHYQVIEGLQPGEKLIVSNILNLSDGTAIIPEP